MVSGSAVMGPVSLSFSAQSLQSILLMLRRYAAQTGRARKRLAFSPRVQDVESTAKGLYNSEPKKAQAAMSFNQTFVCVFVVE